MVGRDSFSAAVPRVPLAVPVAMGTTDGASGAASTPLGVHAVASTSAETTGLFRSRPLAVPVAGTLPRNPGGSASALTFSRPARRSLASLPARSLSLPTSRLLDCWHGLAGDSSVSDPIPDHVAHGALPCGDARTEA